MVTKHGFVRNPLSVIAIFAGVAEVSGAFVLPKLAGHTQTTFMIFVMFFPCALVGLFFYVLWFKAKVLYAPADYKDDATYMAANGLNKYSVDGQIAGGTKATSSQPEVAADHSSETTTDSDISDQANTDNLDNEDNGSTSPNSGYMPELGLPSGNRQNEQEDSNKHSPPVYASFSKQISPDDAESIEHYLAERKGLSALRKKYGGRITAPVIMSADGGAPYIIDGFIENEEHQYLIEVLYAAKDMKGRRILGAASRLATAWNAAPAKEQMRLVCVICIVTKSDSDLKYQTAYAHTLLMRSYPSVNFRIEAFTIDEIS